MEVVDTVIIKTRFSGPKARSVNNSFQWLDLGNLGVIDSRSGGLQADLLGGLGGGAPSGKREVTFCM